MRTNIIKIYNYNNKITKPETTTTTPKKQLQQQQNNKDFEVMSKNHCPNTVRS